MFFMMNPASAHPHILAVRTKKKNNFSERLDLRTIYPPNRFYYLAIKKIKKYRVSNSMLKRYSQLLFFICQVVLLNRDILPELLFCLRSIVPALLNNVLEVFNILLRENFISVSDPHDDIHPGIHEKVNNIILIQVLY